MAARSHLFVLVAVAAILTCVRGLEAQVTQGGVTYLQPAWQPVHGAGSSPARFVAYNANAGVANAGAAPTASNGWPYYTNSPLYRSTGTTFTPMPATVSAPATWSASGRPAIVPDQMIQPMVSSPTGLVPGTPAPPTSASVPVEPAPVTSLIPSAPTTTAAPAQTVASPVVATPPPSPPPTTPVVTNPAPVNPEPFVDPNVFVPGGQSWIDVDISSYTSRFPAASQPEQSVREWILRKTDPSSWMGGEVASLVVTPDRVRIYHTPAVQQQVRDLLGRMLYYTPGEFQTRVQVINVQSPRWRAEAGSSLSAVGTSGKVWVGPLEEIAKLSSSLASQETGTMLANPDVVVFNGQKLHVGWSPSPGRDPDPQRTGRPIEEGIVVDVSPLIDSDAASIEIDLSAAVRRDAVQSQSLFRPSSSATASTQVEEGALHELVRVQPGQGIVASVGQVSSFDNSKGFLGRNKAAEIVVVVACRPSPNNTINGRPIVLASASGPQRSTSNRPVASGGDSPRRKNRLPKPFIVPPELTRPVD